MRLALDLQHAAQRSICAACELDETVIRCESLHIRRRAVADRTHAHEAIVEPAELRKVRHEDRLEREAGLHRELQRGIRGSANPVFQPFLEKHPARRRGGDRVAHAHLARGAAAKAGGHRTIGSIGRRDRQGRSNDIADIDRGQRAGISRVVLGLELHRVRPGLQRHKLRKRIRRCTAAHR